MSGAHGTRRVCVQLYVLSSRMGDVSSDVHPDSGGHGPYTGGSLDKLHCRS